MLRSKYPESWGVLKSGENHVPQRSKTSGNLSPEPVWNTSLDLHCVRCVVCAGDFKT